MAHAWSNAIARMAAARNWPWNVWNLPNFINGPSTSGASTLRVVVRNISRLENSGKSDAAVSLALLAPAACVWEVARGPFRPSPAMKAACCGQDTALGLENKWKQPCLNCCQRRQRNGLRKRNNVGICFFEDARFQQIEHTTAPVLILLTRARAKRKHVEF